MAADERRWAKEHPEPQVAVTADRLTLWNYPVGRAELSPEHQAAIRRFASVGMLSPRLSALEFSVRGHASISGEGGNNMRLSQMRAEAVGSYLRSLGFQSVEVSAAGSKEPADPAPTGQSYARNRRVELVLFVPPLGDPKAKPVPLDLGGQPQLISSATGGSPTTPNVFVSFESALSLDLGTLYTALVEINAHLEGKMTGKVTGKQGAVGFNAVSKNNALSAEFEATLREDLKAKLGIEPASHGNPATVKLGFESEKWALTPEVGLQLQPRFIYFNAKLVKARMPDIVFGDVTVSLEFEGTLELEVGPSRSLVARLAPYALPALEAAGTAAAVTGAVGGALGVAAVIIGGTIYAAEDARREGLRFARTLAGRDGAACRVALEVLGGDALGMFKQRRLEFMKLGQGLQSAFDAGVATVESLLRKSGGDGREARRTAWAAAYAKGAGPADFTLVRERVFLRLGGYDKDERDLAGDVAQV